MAALAAVALVVAGCGDDEGALVQPAPPASPQSGVSTPPIVRTTPGVVYTTPGSGTTPVAPSTTFEADEALPAVVAARTDLATRFERPVTDVQVLSVDAMTWPDACLNVTFLGRQDEVCAQVITPGYEVVLECGGVPLCCRITGSSLTEMGIRPGQPLWAVFKASSCFLVQE